MSELDRSSVALARKAVVALARKAVAAANQGGTSTATAVLVRTSARRFPQVAGAPQGKGQGKRNHTHEGRRMPRGAAGPLGSGERGHLVAWIPFEVFGTSQLFLKSFLLAAGKAS
jgi:hypothetical protein